MQIPAAEELTPEVARREIDAAIRAMVEKGGVMPSQVLVRAAHYDALEAEFFQKHMANWKNADHVLYQPSGDLPSVFIARGCS